MNLTSRSLRSEKIVLWLDEVPREESLAGLRSSIHQVLLQTNVFQCRWDGREIPGLRNFCAIESGISAASGLNEASCDLAVREDQGNTPSHFDSKLRT